jgi:hypothetical protein
MKKLSKWFWVASSAFLLVAVIAPLLGGPLPPTL